MIDEPLSILIADDEAIVREGIRDRIDWTALGYRLIGDFEDGRSALEAARSHRPDVVLTDIRMPFLDGIELTRRVVDELPDTQVLLLTGHDEFEYAQSAVRLHVRDFLLKPISARELEEVLDRLAGDLRAERARRRSAERVRRQWHENLPILTERALNELLYGERPVEDALARLRQLGVTLPTGRCRVVIVEPDDIATPGAADPEHGPDGVATPSPGSPELVTIALSDLVQRECARELNAALVATRHDRLALLVTGPDRDLAERLERIRLAAPREAGLTVTIALGRAYGRLSEIRRSLADAETALARRFLSGGNRVVSADEVAAGPAAARGAHAELRSALVGRIRHIDRYGAHDVAARLIDHCRTATASVTEAVLALQRDLARLLDLAEELDLATQEFSPAGANPFEELARLPTLAAIHRWLDRLIDRLLDQLEQAVGDHTEVKVRAACALIDERFAEADLSLTAVAEELSVSVSHLSTSFRRVTGRTFVEYLTDARIERARELFARTSVHGYEVAQRVGYRDPHYFSTTFKKVTGMTPTEYRRSLERAADGNGAPRRSGRPDGGAEAGTG